MSRGSWSRASWSFVLALAGCAAHSFEPRFSAPPAPKPSIVIGELTQKRARSERPVAVALTADPARLIAWDLERGKLWEQPVDAKSAPLIAADAVVLQEAEGVALRDLASGALRTRLDEKAVLIGADGEGDRLVVSMAQALPNQPGEIALVQGDSVRWRQKLGLAVGVPALFGEYVIVPWATQRLSVLAAADGQELGRFHYKSTVMGHALVQDGKLYVGQLGLLPVERELLESPGAKHTPYAPLKRSLPGQPPLLSDGYLPVPPPDSAVHRLQISWAMDPHASEPASAANLLVLHFYRLVFGMSADSDEIRWLRSFDHDVVGAAVQAGGVWLADSSGQLRFLDEAGRIRVSQAIGRELRVAAIRPRSSAPQSANVAPEAGLLPPLRAQVQAAASLKDDRLAAARAYAAAYLGRLPEPEATADLLALCTQTGDPEPVRAAACSELGNRKNGEGALLEALRRHASYLEDRPAPPLAPLALAAAGMQLKAAGPLLAQHLDDPHTSARDLARACESIGALGERGALPSLERFVRLHHAEPEGSEWSPALAAALQTLGALRAPNAKATLQLVADDRLSPESTRAKAQAALAVLNSPPPKPAAVAAENAAKQAPARLAAPADPRDYALNAELIRKTFQPFQARLAQCLEHDVEHPRSARAQLVIDPEGKIEAAYVLPASLQACAEPILREAHFPATRAGRQRISHTFYGANAKAKASAQLRPRQ